MDVRGRLDRLKRHGLLDLPDDEGQQKDSKGHAPALSLEAVTTSEGRAWRRMVIVPAEHRHGTVTLATISEQSPGALSLLSASDISPRNWEQVVFLDTETTGLSMGTGTHVFLVGLSYLQRQDVVLEQIFLPDPGEEPAFLALVRRRLEAFSHVVTFNGRSFDLPLLVHRFTLNRMTRSFDFSGHHDLLHPARRLWRQLLDSCRLTALEQHRLGFERADDIPGSEVPARYFLYLREQDPESIAPVFEHNALDLLSSMALAHHMLTLVEKPRRGLTVPEAVAAGRMAEAAHQTVLACRFFDWALDNTPGSALFLKTARAISLFHKRAGRWNRAVNVWEAMVKRIESGGQSAMLASIFPYVELAKYYEHRMRDFGVAAHYTQKALRQVARQSALVPTEPTLAQLHHRLSRINRRWTKADDNAHTKPR